MVKGGVASAGSADAESAPAASRADVDRVLDELRRSQARIDGLQASVAEVRLGQDQVKTQLQRLLDVLTTQRNAETFGVA